MKKLPSTLNLTWHKGYKKCYPDSSGAYVVVIQNKKSPHYPAIDFAVFVKETINSINFDKWRPLVNWTFGDIFVKKNLDSKVEILEWAKIDAKQSKD